MMTPRVDLKPKYLYATLNNKSMAFFRPNPVLHTPREYMYNCRYPECQLSVEC